MKIVMLVLSISFHFISILSDKRLTLSHRLSVFSSLSRVIHLMNLIHNRCLYHNQINKNLRFYKYLVGHHMYIKKVMDLGLILADHNYFPLVQMIVH